MRKRTLERNLETTYGTKWIFLFVVCAAGALTISACSLPTVLKQVVVEDIVDTFGPASMPLRLLASLGGALLLFAGWKIYRFIVALPGLLVGAMFGVQLALRLDQSGWIALLGLVLGGGLGVWLALTLHDLAIFTIGALGGTFLAGSLWDLLFNTPPTLLLEVIAAIVGGILLVSMARAWMMLLSAAVGATMLAWGIQANVIVIPVFFLLGILVQSTLSRAMGERAYEEPLEEQELPSYE